FLSYGCGFLSSNTPSLQNTSLKPLPQDAAIQVYFNHNPISMYDDPYRNFKREGDNLEAQIINQINQAKSTIDLAVLEFRLTKLAEALISKHKQGINVRVIIDNQYNKTLNDYTPEEVNKMNPHDRSRYEDLKLATGDALAMLKNSGITVKDDTSENARKGSGLMHHKFIIIDNKTTIISSANFTLSDVHGDFNNRNTRGNPNNMLVIPNHTQIAQVFTDEFNYMWSGLFKIHKPYREPVTLNVGQGKITINFSPSRKKTNIDQTSNGIISYFIKQVKTSAYLALFVFSDQQISDTLNEVRNKGVEDIKILIDKDFYQQNYSNAYDAMGLCPKGQLSKKIKPWQNPIKTVGYPLGIKGDRSVHSKMAILDHVLVITGSHNWSDAANYLNDETLVIIENPTVSQHYEREFNRLYSTAIIGEKSLPSGKKCQNNITNETEENEIDTD
ncbi:MAG TPA: phosphatidylserine/phosphatidylglycerophosphate/cardiolipin synthase family protein, partial [Allocoleopsis sp.]